MDELQDRDPLHRHAAVAAPAAGTSPMDPPSAWAPPATAVVPYEELHPFLRRLVDEHAELTERLASFEATLQQIRTGGLTREHGASLRSCFEYFERELPRHQRSEERRLFPRLRQRLIERGEHGATAPLATGVDVLEEDHVRSIRQLAVANGFIGLALRLADAESGMTALAMGVEQGTDFVEGLRLHLFREENIMFGLAQRHFTAAELDALLAD